MKISNFFIRNTVQKATEQPSAVKKPYYYAIYRFRNTVYNVRTPAKTDYLFIRKTEVHFLGLAKGAGIFQLLTTHFDFEGSIFPFFKNIAYVFDEVIVAVNKEGNITQVKNTERLGKRWATTKNELLKQHSGDEFYNYVHSIDMLLDNEASLVDFFAQPKMFGALFNGYWIAGGIEQTEQPFPGTNTGQPKEIQISGDQKCCFQSNRLIESCTVIDNTKNETLCLGIKKII